MKTDSFMYIFAFHSIKLTKNDSHVKVCHNMLMFLRFTTIMESKYQLTDVQLFVPAIKDSVTPDVIQFLVFPFEGALSISL